MRGGGHSASCWRTLLLGILLPILQVLAGSVEADERGEAGVEIFRGVPYAKRGTTHLEADVYVPRGPGPFPGVLMLHGGGWVSGYRQQMNFHARMLAERGFTVATFSYRLAPRFTFPAQLVDCRDALRWMCEHAPQYKIDPTRLAGFGYSAGAQLICLLGNEAERESGTGMAAADCDPGGRLRALVAGGTPCDLASGAHGSFLPRVYLGGPPDKLPEVYRAASPVTHVSTGSPPTFFYHGEVDRLVHPAGAEAMSSRLRELGVRSELYLVPGKGHIGAFHDDLAIEKAADFLADVLAIANSAPPAPGLSGGGR